MSNERKRSRILTMAQDGQKSKRKKLAGSHDSRTHRTRGSGRAGPQPRGYEVIAMLSVMHSDGERLSTLDMLANTRPPREQGGVVSKEPGSTCQMRWPLLASSWRRGPSWWDCVSQPGQPKRLRQKESRFHIRNRYFWPSTVGSIEFDSPLASVPLIPDRGLGPGGPTCSVWYVPQ
jgi:hypothetical protein